MPYPAPTGIIDYELRQTGNGTPAATVIANVGPYDAWGISVDGTLPLAGKELIVPMGVATQVSTGTSYGDLPGYTSRATNFGATPQWSPNDWLTVRGLFDWQETRDITTPPEFFTAGDFLPPPIPRGYLGQNWAKGRSITENSKWCCRSSTWFGWYLYSASGRSLTLVTKLPDCT